MQVTVFDIRPIGEADVETIVGDLRKPDDVLQACKGAQPPACVHDVVHDGSSWLAAGPCTDGACGSSDACTPTLRGQAGGAAAPLTHQMQAQPPAASLMRAAAGHTMATRQCTAHPCQHATVPTQFAGRDVVFHCATAAPSAANASNKELMYAVNVRGTEHVVSACKVRIFSSAARSIRSMLICGVCQL